MSLIPLCLAPFLFWFRFPPNSLRKDWFKELLRFCLSIGASRPLIRVQMALSLRPYQEEVVQVALRGENSIIWLPTGGGKTRAAVYVTDKHLESTDNAKVVVLVNKVHLVDQHFAKEFKPFLGNKYRVTAISGDSSEKDFFGRIVKDTDVVICTAQILENALNNMDEDKHVELTDFTLVVIDECHHTHKENVYNKIMARYLKKKLRKEGKLPQILGLTASPGTGGKKTQEKAEEHVLQICANLDSVIVSTKNYKSVLQEVVPRPQKKYDIVEKRTRDPFGDHLKSMMGMIHVFMPSAVNQSLRKMGTQEYEADVVELEKAGVRRGSRLIAQCALHLRQYNDALLINDTIRMVDAFRVLQEFYSKKTLLDETDVFLQDLFMENCQKLKLLASDACYENPKLAQLQSTLLKEFREVKESRGILFSKTRRGTSCLLDWVRSNPELQNYISAGILTGAGAGANCMTQNEQKETINQFRKGSLNLLISTSVAEEGLDIPECNLVVRYGLLTNEIAQQQASGRARAANSIYSVVAEEGGREICREHTNEYLEELTARAIAKVQLLSPREFGEKVLELQEEAVRIRMEAERKMEEKRKRYRPAQVQIHCRGCFSRVCSGEDIRTIENSQHVNINDSFNIGFTFQAPNKNCEPKMYWKDVEFQVKEFNFTEYMSTLLGGLGLDD
ncbi:hypothetical protein DNTS_035253 [Danionella cerebrum]|uniref:RNA helicase n=1 Tax=Danionella cerebrum TaxID=2873325 RepID=A0A553N317_9TELE|nr:hypothetical protein DNTS_035253 [Danionella translucida]